MRAPMRHWRGWLLLALTLAAVAAVMAQAPIPQDPAYHAFADTRTLLGVPNFWNVASNLPFALAGGWGLWRARALGAPTPRVEATVLALGITLVCLGSAWYHLAPANASLTWDRLPMTIAFMALLALVIGERVSERTGRLALAPLLLAGLGSVAWWTFGEARGAGDLRPYALVQFLSIVLIAALLLLWPRRWLRDGRLWAAMGFYALAKLAEHFDAAIFAAIGITGGHAIKHLLAAVAAWLILSASTSGIDRAQVSARTH